MPSTAVMPSSSSEPDTFWIRQESVAPQMDHPDMLSTPHAPQHPNFELLIATSAGKPLLHFVYDHTHPQHPNYDSEAPPTRPRQSLTTLSATLTAFQASTHDSVTFITSTTSTLLTYTYDNLHAILVARQKPAPTPLLHALLRLAVAATLAASSASLTTHLHRHPTATPSLSAAEPLLRATLLDAITHPLPYALHRPLALPSLVHSASRNPVANLLHNALSAHPHASHALIFAAGPPFPCALIAACGPANSHLSNVDILLLSAWASASTTHDDNQHPRQCQGQKHSSSLDRDGAKSMRFYPHSKMFHTGVTAFARLLYLRLHPDHHDAFKRAVGGPTWRPEWTRLPPHAIRLVVLANGDATTVFDVIDATLDRSRATTQLIISMERPFHTQCFQLPGLRAVISLHADGRLAGTLGAFAYEVGICVLESLRLARSEMQRRQSGGALLDEWRRDGMDAIVTSFVQWRLRVVVWQLRFVVCFRDEVEEKDAVQLTREIVVPWLHRWKGALVPEGERASVQPRTPLAGLFSPFDS